jgi:hypothetical protein
MSPLYSSIKQGGCAPQETAATDFNKFTLWKHLRRTYFTLHLHRNPESKNMPNIYQYFLKMLPSVKIHIILVAEPLNRCSLCSSFEKKLLPVVKLQNGGCIQDGVEKVSIFQPIFSKMLFLSIFIKY